MNDVDVTQLVALAAALGWASGLRLYLVVFLTGLAGHLGWVELPGGLQLLQQPLLLWVSGGLVAVEFLADKIPLVDSAWDAVQTVVRIPAGAALAGAVFAGQGIDGATWTLVAALVGGTLAATAHAAKAGTRAAVNTSLEPFSNLALSLAGDAFVPLLLWLAWEHPVAFFVALALAVVVAAGLIAVTFKFVGALWRRLRGRLSPVGA
ncbi:DUF4126 domain-containing protein [Calidifontimicrobium sp. SYSU G02091]|uniref:DUF4126 domain-containing protein n=1 Tax=Calidifontimicrobium sp. SYSU G02091 TaxID=2926421 RepID=UPI001F53ADE3|nr:DUF4126 domain-containing protein [Calidifontimicrobium sp. SYSU G02091]